MMAAKYVTMKARNSMVKVNLKRKTEFPLYEALYQGEKYDGNVRYEMVMILCWSNATDNAKCLGSKVFYFKGTKGDAMLMINALGGAERVYHDYNHLERFCINYDTER